MKKPILVVAVIIIVGIAVIYLAFAGNNQPENQNQNKTNFNRPIKVGVLGDLSGDYADFLKGIVRGAELAKQDMEDQSNLKIELIIEDQQSCNAKETVTIMNKLTSIDQVDLIVGGSCSNTTLAAAPIANSSQTILISPSSSAPSITNAGDYVFRTYISDSLRAEVAAQTDYELGKRKMATITDSSNDAAIELAQAGETKFTQLGGQIVSSEKAGENDNDFKAIITKIKAANPDIILITITSPKQSGIILKQLREFELNVLKISPFETVEDQEVLDIAGEAANDIIYIMPGNPPRSERLAKIEENYQQKYNETDMPQYMAESYDALMLGVKAVAASNDTKEDIKDKLHLVSQSYKGLSGDVSFDSNGNVTKDLLMKMIKDGQFVEYK